jgi:hypothetical protein
VLAEALGKPGPAVAHYEHAVERNRALGYRVGVVRSLLAHGKLLLQQRKTAPGRDLLERARSEAERSACAGRWPTPRALG